MRRIVTACALIALVALAGRARLVGHEAVLDGPRVHLVDPDSHYHARRISRAAEALPGLPPRYDPLIAYPDRYPVAWPPGFDVLAALLVRVAGAPIDTDAVARIGTLFVVALGAFTVCVVFLLGRRLTGSGGWALLGGALIAVWPLHLEYSRVGRIDHHVLEPLVTALTLWLYLRATAGPNHRLRRAIGCGLAMGAAFWLWPTALLPMGLLAAVLLVDQLQSNTPSAARSVSIVFATAAIVVAPLALTAPAELRWALHGPSLVHLLALSLLLGSSAWAAVVMAQRWPRAAIVAGPLAVAGCVVLVAPLGDALRLGGMFGARGGLWGMILEQRPLTMMRPLNIVLLLTYVGFALPGLIFFATRGPRSPGGRRELSLTVAITLLTMAAGLFQVRFLPIALVLGAPLAAAGVQEATRRLQKLLVGHARPALLNAVPIVTVALTLIGLQPAVVFLEESINVPHARELSREAAARWLGANRLTAPDGPAVMAALGVGHLLVHLGRVPTIGSALIEPGTAAATRDTLLFFTARTDEEVAAARAIIDRRRAGRVVATRLPPRRYGRYLAHLGRPADDEVVLQKHRRCLATRLHVDSGSGAILGRNVLAPIGWLRHEWEAVGPFGAPLTQVFRRVRGARLVVAAPANATVDLTLPLLTPAGRPFVYRARATAPADGRVTFRVPYPADADEPNPTVIAYLRAVAAHRHARGDPSERPSPPKLARTIAVGALQLASGAARATVMITEGAVRSGDDIRVTLNEEASPRAGPIDRRPR